MSLSEKRIGKNNPQIFENIDDIYWGKDIKKAVKDAKEKIDYWNFTTMANRLKMLRALDKIFGDKLRGDGK